MQCAYMYVADVYTWPAVHGWVESIGVANKDTVFTMLVGLAKPFEA